MKRRWRGYAAAAATVGIFALVQLGALALVHPFEAAGFVSVEDPTNPTNSLVYVGAILVATAAMLGAFKVGAQWLVRGFIVLSSALLSWYVFSVVVPPLVVIDGLNALATLLSLAVAVGLLVYPEWYVIDAAGIVMGAGAAGLFGISFGLLPAIVLLSVLAVYDAISVYGTEHMLTLAEGVMDLKIPVILVVPLRLSYSFLSTDEGGDDPDLNPSVDSNGGEGSVDASEGGEGSVGNDGNDENNGAGEDGFDRDALFIGLGDAVMPTVMVASAAFFAPAPSLGVPGLAVNLPALTAAIGTLLGLVVLLRMVLAGNPHAGLPLLNGGAIGGYLLGALASGIPLVRALGLAPYLAIVPLGP